MAYFCAKCGAVVTGKYCSCCGTRARNDLKEFRLELRRRKKQFCNRHDSPYSVERSMMAQCAWNILEWRLCKGLDTDNFSEKSELAFSSIPQLEDSVENLYVKFIKAFSEIIEERKAGVSG